MGKQVEYWMDYDSFLLVAQKAIDLGCSIVRQDLRSGKVTEGNDIGIVTRVCTRYYFHLLEAGDIKVNTVNGRELLERGYTASGNAVIEAGYSPVADEPTGPCGNRRKKEIRRARMFCTSGYYDEEGTYVPRPTCLTKAYDSLARYVKKVAPYTDVSGRKAVRNPEASDKPVGGGDKVYITRACLDMVEQQGFRLC